jgi:excisionase family DNA binding protein
MTNTTDRLLTQREVSELLGLSVKTLQVLRRNRKIEFVRFGHRTIRIRESEVSRFCSQHSARVREDDRSLPEITERWRR